MDGAKKDFTEILNRWTEGVAGAEEQVFEAAYGEIRQIVRRQMVSRRNWTLQPTEVVHEAYFRLAGAHLTRWKHRAQFFKLTAMVIRQVLVDYGRSRNAKKRGAGNVKLDIEPDRLQAPPGDDLDFFLGLDRALNRLADFDRQASKIVELRYFGGLTVPETARALETSTATVSRRWRAARAWLRRELDLTPREPNTTTPGGASHGA